MRNMKILGVPLFCILLFLSCNNDTPLVVREDLVDRGDLGSILQRSPTVTTDSTTAGEIVNTSSAGFLLLGTKKNLESRILFRFDPLPDTGQVVEAKLRLPVDEAKGETGSFTAAVYQATSPWSESKIIWEKDKEFPVQFDPAPMDEQSITATVSDTTDTVAFNLNPAVVASWQSAKGTNRDTMGVMIQAPSANFMKEFYSRASSQRQPFLELRHRVRISGRDSTVASRRLATAAVFVFKRSGAPLPDNRLYEGNGEKFQSVAVFTLSDILPDTIPQNATVNRAKLILQTDVANSFFVDTDSRLTFSLYYALKKYGLDTLKTTADSLLVLQANSIGASNTTIEFNVTSLVQSWVRTPPQIRQPPESYGYLYLLPEFPAISLARAAFYSHEAEVAQAPKINIEYTTPPKTP